MGYDASRQLKIKYETLRLSATYLSAQNWATFMLTSREEVMLYWVFFTNGNLHKNARSNSSTWTWCWVKPWSPALVWCFFQAEKKSTCTVCFLLGQPGNLAKPFPLLGLPQEQVLHGEHLLCVQLMVDIFMCGGIISSLSLSPVLPLAHPLSVKVMDLLHSVCCKQLYFLLKSKVCPNVIVEW